MASSSSRRPVRRRDRGACARLPTTSSRTRARLTRTTTSTTSSRRIRAPSRVCGGSRRPHMQHRSIAAVMRHEKILEILRQLIGPAIRFDTSKLNMKSPGYGAAVEWHQDWAFYPHTNDDLCAVGVMMDDCGIENGPLLCIPASHRGPIYDHHAEGRLLRGHRSRQERHRLRQCRAMHRCCREHLDPSRA